MQFFALPLIVGPLVLLSAVPALAQPAAPPDKSVATPAVNAAPPAPEHASTVQTSRDTMATWRGKLDAFGADAKGTAAAAGSDADRDLHAAWTKLQSAAEWLQNVGADGWTAAKATYDKAADDMDAAWHRVHPA